MNTKRLFNDGWEFAKSSLEAPDSDNLEFEPVDIPHDWLIYDTLNLYEDSIGWYRKNYTYDGGASQVLLYFDGIYMDSSLYVNGQFVGEWKYGYSSFEHNITDALQEGNNEILVKVVHQSPNSRWYSGAGIYRNVWLKERSENHIVTDGIYVKTEPWEDGWQVEVDTELNTYQDVRLTQTIIFEGQELAKNSTIVPADRNKTISCNTQKLFVEKPLLWSPDSPELYNLITKLELAINLDDHIHPGNVSEKGDIKYNSNIDDKSRETDANIGKTVESNPQLIEVLSQKIGFRKIELDPDRGFILNGRKMKLNGVCEHHDLGALGAVFNKAALERRFTILKEMGVNAVRTAHNMPAVEFMELADEMGLMVVSEAFDMWERPKTKYDYARFFREWAYKDVKSWIKRDRNHPSLIMWSIGNEIYDTHADEKGQELTRMLMDWVHEFDPEENGKVTIGSNYMPWENAQKCADIVKIAGYNYGEKYYYLHHQAHPDWVIYGSETGSVVQSRGIYHFPAEKSILADDDEQCSALGNSATSWGAKSTEDNIKADRDVSFSLGQFIWTGFDYIGEPTPYHTKNSYFGQIDTATFKKDSYYIYQAEWTDYRIKPMVHIFPYWDFSEGQMIDVRVCSNAPEIELQLNGQTIGNHIINHSSGNQLVGTWKVPYKEGELKAIAYDVNGEVIATEVRKSYGDAKKIRMKSSKNMLLADGRDLIFVEITVEDREGNPVENATNRVNVEVSGAGRLIGLDNGDSTDYDQYKGLSRRLFSGKLMAVIAAKLEPGPIKVEVSSKGLESKSAVYQAIPVESEDIEGITADMENQVVPVVMGDREEIPVRKIDIISNSVRILDESVEQVNVKARLYPDNTSYQDVEWSIVNDTGIELDIAEIEAEGLEARVRAFGDGKFRVRCTSKNGTDSTKIISELEFKAIGLGTAYKDPYSFISAGLYDYSKGEVGNGNERGVATARDGETQVGFRDIDFGPVGSDTITIPIFALSSDEYSLQIYEGMPEEEDSELIADVTYQKETRWNVYQEETYKLSRRLKGITSICFVLNKKVHIKGFSFKKKSRAFEQIFAAESDHIYGDTYTINEKRVEGIGNNVSLEFNNMDFGNDGAAKLVICGKSPIDKNTIHIKFEGENNNYRENGQSGSSYTESKQNDDSKGLINHSLNNQMFEFTKSDGYEERTFEIEKITGSHKVIFVFLPGSNFDFAWFRFEK